MQLHTLLRNGSPLSALFSVASALFLSPRGWYPPRPRHMRHAAPLSPVASLDCASILSPRGCGVREPSVHRASSVADEAAAMIFLASPEQDGEHSDGDNLKAGDSPCVANAIPQRVLDGVCGRGQQNSELIRKARHQAAGRIRRQLIQVHWDDTPGARSEEHTSELQSRQYLVCRLLLEKK